MDNGEMKLEIPSSEGAEMTSPTSGRSPGSAAAGLATQGSVTKSNCLCSPTTHAGSFRCRLHRALPVLQRTKSIDSAPALKDSDHQSKPNNTSCDPTIKRNTVEAQ